MGSLRRREALESVLLALLGAGGIVLGLRTLVPTPTVAQPAPIIAPPEGGWPPLPETSDRVVRYQLQAKLDPDAHTIEGKGTVTLRNTSTATLEDLRLHLYLNAFKNDLTIFRRARVGGFRGDRHGAPGLIDVKKLTIDGVDHWPKRELATHLGESPQDPLRKGTKFPLEGAPDDETDVRVPLEKKIAPGESVTFEVEWKDELPEVSERTGYSGSFHFAGQWFPKLAKLENDGTWATFPFHHLAEFYADYGSYDVTIDVPQAYVVGASGPLVDEKIENGRRIAHHVLDDVHDFAWTAWNKFVVRETSEGSVKIRHLAPPGYDQATDRELVSVVHTLRDLGARFGAYPYPVLTVVHPPEDADEAGGMEYPTLITTGGPWWPAHGSHEVEGVTVHELGHQWFYGLVGTHEVEWPSGDEGFNSFGELLAMERMYGRGTAVATRGLDVSYLVFARRGVDPEFDEPIFQPAYAFANGRAYGGRVYGATSMALDTLRNVYGPVTFDAAMGVYTRRYRFRHPRPEDFFAVLDEIAGQDCGAAARAALTTPSTLDFYVSEVTSAKRRKPAGVFDLPAGRKKEESPDTQGHAPADASLGYVSSAWLGRRGVVDLPVDVELHFADGSRRREVVRFGTPINTWRRIDADGPSELTGVVIDPDLKISLDRSRLNNFASISGKGGGAPVARERALAWLGILVREVGP